MEGKGLLKSQSKRIAKGQRQLVKWQRKTFLYTSIVASQPCYVPKLWTTFRGHHEPLKCVCLALVALRMPSQKKITGKVCSERFRKGQPFRKGGPERSRKGSGKVRKGSPERCFPEVPFRTPFFEAPTERARRLEIRIFLLMFGKLPPLTAHYEYGFPNPLE